MNKSENRDTAVTVYKVSPLEAILCIHSFHRLRQEMEVKLLDGTSTQITGTHKLRNMDPRSTVKKLMRIIKSPF